MKQGESKWRREWLQWLKRRSKWLKRRRWCYWWSSKLMLQWWSLVAVSCYKHQVFLKKTSYICTGLKWKYRRKAPKFAGIAETSRYTPVFWAVRFNPVSVPVQAPERNIPAVPAGTVRNRLPWCCHHIKRCHALSIIIWSFFIVSNNILDMCTVNGTNVVLK